MILYSCSLAAFQAVVGKCAHVFMACKRHSRSQVEGAGQTQVGFGPWGFACASPLRKALFPGCAWSWVWSGIGVEFRGDALLACRDRGCSSSGREQVERQEKRELFFENKPSGSCSGMPGVGVMSRALAAHPGNTHPQGERAGQGSGWAGCFLRGQGGHRDRSYSVPSTSRKFCPTKGQTPFQ